MRLRHTRSSRSDGHVELIPRNLRLVMVAWTGCPGLPIVRPCPDLTTQCSSPALGICGWARRMPTRCIGLCDHLPCRSSRYELQADSTRPTGRSITAPS
jgi:hypothetical protein